MAIEAADGAGLTADGDTVAGADEEMAFAVAATSRAAAAELFCGDGTVGFDSIAV